ncbi:MAG: hypothetical protein KJ000_11565 [Pirellulaceae bacterium]|nr:hypothetical protein [Pirellulaceae bacterium]
MVTSQRRIPFSSTWLIVFVCPLRGSNSLPTSFSSTSWLLLTLSLASSRFSVFNRGLANEPAPSSTKGGSCSRL